MTVSSIGKTVSSKIMAGALASVIAVSGAAAFAQPAFADINDGTSQSVEFTVPDLGIEDTLTADGLRAAGVLHDDDYVGYLYRMGDGQWYVCTITDFVTLSELIDYVGLDADEVWTEGSALNFTTYNLDKATGKYSEGAYTKYDFTYEALLDQNDFFPSMKVDGSAWENAAPTENSFPALAFNYKSEKIGQDAGVTNIENAIELRSGAVKPDTRFVVGLSADKIDQTSDYNMGKRFPSAVTRMELTLS